MKKKNENEKPAHNYRPAYLKLDTHARLRAAADARGMKVAPLATMLVEYALDELSNGRAKIETVR